MISCTLLRPLFQRDSNPNTSLSQRSIKLGVDSVWNFEVYFYKCLSQNFTSPLLVPGRHHKTCLRIFFIAHTILRQTLFYDFIAIIFIISAKQLLYLLTVESTSDFLLLQSSWIFFLNQKIKMMSNKISISSITRAESYLQMFIICKRILGKY